MRFESSSERVLFISYIDIFIYLFILFFYLVVSLLMLLLYIMIFHEVWSRSHGKNWLNI